MSKPTQGPWFVVAQNNVGSQGTQVWACGGDFRVANCDSGAVSLEGRRADARLIAAAPELLDACKHAASWLEGWASAEPHLSRLLTAIAKAEGRTE
jgi:hypothetical protein